MSAASSSLGRMSRGALSVVLIVAATVLAVAGGVALYAREEIVDADAFTERAVDAVERDPVREVVSREIVVQLIDRGSTDLISARPVLESVVEFVVASQPFQRVLRASAAQAHRLLFVRDTGNASFDVADAGTVVISALRSVSPDVAKHIPPDADATLLELRNRSFATQTLRLADEVRMLGLVLPALALLLYALAVLVAPDRRGAVTRAGIALGAGCALVAIAVRVLESRVVANVHGSDELTDADVQAAVREVLDVYLGDLFTWALVLGAFALLVAAASASLLRPLAAGETLERLRAAARPPRRRGWRVARGGAIMVLGAFVVLEPLLALETIAVVGGALLLYLGTAELLSAVQPRDRTAQTRARRRLWPALAAGALAVAVCAGALVAVLGGGDDDGAVPAQAAVTTCNGYAELCDRRLDQVVFPGTHNSMSAADTKGWLLANQRRTIPRQLRDGIRLFLIDPHYGVQDRGGRVRTDFAAERRGLNRVGKNLTPEAQRALRGVGGGLGVGTFKGKRDVWLCHSVCELGATNMVAALTDIRRFLERNPGEVVILFDEDYVTERDLAKVYRRAGLMPYLAVLDRDEPLPTLRQLIRGGKRVIVFTEREPSGEYEWNHEGFSFIQDTPLGATKASAFSCALNRGDASNPLLAVNNWIDRFPPPLSANREVLKPSFVQRRLRRCERERGLRPTLVASDFYDQGGLVEAAHRLNGMGDRKPAPPR